MLLLGLFLQVSDAKPTRSLKTRIGYRTSTVPYLGYERHHHDINYSTTISPIRSENGHTSSGHETPSAAINSEKKNHKSIGTPGKEIFWKTNCGSESKDEYLLIYYSMVSVLILL